MTKRHTNSGKHAINRHRGRSARQNSAATGTDESEIVDMGGSGSSIAVAEKAAAKNQGESWFKRFGVPLILVLLGVAILLYPIGSTLWNNHVQQQAAHEYADLVKELDPTEIKAELAEAREYNANRTVGPILDPWTSRLADDNEPYKAYLEQLNLVDVMARVVIPSIEVDLPVYHGTRPDTLERGVGHLFGTDLPVGGDSTHSVLTAHTGLQNATLFDNLTEVKIGDSIYVEVYGERMRYQVYDTEVVLPDEATGLGKHEGKDLITLITCTPYGVNSHRLLVHAERVPMDDTTVLDEGVGFSVPWWMVLFGALALLGVILIAWFVLRSKKSQDETVDASDSSEVDDSVED